METAASKIAGYLESFRKGERDLAFFGLLEMGDAALADLMAAFRSERDLHVRELLVEVIWQHRQFSVIPFLEEVLRDAEPALWKHALDGLVTLASEEAIGALRAAKARRFPTQRQTDEFHRWLDEAVEQATSELEGG